MAKVYFKAVDSYSKTEEISSTARELLTKLVEEENVTLEKFIPLKVHFGEKGNNTFIQSKNYAGVIEYLKEKSIESAFIETNVLYRGERTTREKHINLAKEHGFTELPIIIADGEHGEAYSEVEINKKNFNKCKVGKEIADKKQLIIMSHFKGHALAGFGGAIKQLGMGCAARGGKLAQHANSIPKISYLKCKSCKACAKRCPESAITVDKKAKIDKDKCVGCASCMAICPYGAISNSWMASISKSFNERLSEYAYAAAKDKANIYITFAFNITKNCDCEGHSMKPIVNDVGVFASTDPVAIDKACLDVVDRDNGKTVFRRGRYTLDYAEKIGLGSQSYELVEVK
ncbi:DUF362 domain-containing protein [Clostridium folliculivorans]|uniref:4Fe-4S ferredoxin n=1 Tax=Clostridium folliculivorans TaxID=2886038 RepID=A0A9W5Y5V1_9CLOT|nr:DUF362 domain-containing protein [Clostridium folliculivorans]GKU27053.1 4Fe-4S ferredoxin [Clostridium folliculivorans]GKU29105.1 4Fe-4S ferredoxin [Clostridium folliculivorans]